MTKNIANQMRMPRCDIPTAFNSVFNREKSVRHKKGNLMVALISVPDNSGFRVFRGKKQFRCVNQCSLVPSVRDNSTQNRSENIPSSAVVAELAEVDALPRSQVQLVVGDGDGYRRANH